MLHVYFRFILDSTIECLVNPLVLDFARTFPLVRVKSRSLVFFLFWVIPLDILQDRLFTTSLAIEEDDLVYSCSIRIQVEEEAVATYDDLSSWATCFEDIFAYTARNILY